MIEFLYALLLSYLLIGAVIATQMAWVVYTHPDKPRLITESSFFAHTKVYFLVLLTWPRAIKEMHDD
jgi:hypothetical protein